MVDRGRHEDGAVRACGAVRGVADQVASICSVYLPDRGARFYANGRMTTEVDDPAFARAFFDIWLAPGTRAPALRRRLLGESR